MKIDPRTLCQIEIPVTDLGASLAFYREVLGWTEAPCDIHDYAVLDVPDDCKFGISLIAGSKLKSQALGVIFYFRCDDPDEVAAKAEAFFGRTVSPPRTVPGYGTVRIIEDPDGHKMGLFQT